ncbi:MAG: asparagine synthetase B, partial [Actinomycetota bacterium]
MATALARRGPDQAGYLGADAAGVALGHRRLSVIDLTPSGAQPMTSRSGRWTVVYNGEIYNHHEVRGLLGDTVAEWRGHSDTETLVEAIDAWGVAATLPRLEGMFAIAAYDSVEGRLVLARDRLGEKPIYWTQQHGGFAFASELSALRTLPDLALEIDPSAVTALLRWSFIPHPHTIYL